MSGMNEFLAQYYGTNGATEVEKTAGADSSDKEKVAMFAKLAKDNNIDLSSLSDAQLEKLFQDTFSKTAGELPPQFQKKDEGEKKDEKKEDEEKKAAAAAEKQEQEKKAAKELQEKQAEQADWMGRVMAHAYVNEMRKIAADAEAKTAAATQGAGTNNAPAAAPTETKTASIREKLLKLAEKDEKPEEKKDEKKDGDDKGKNLPPWMKDKEASASLEDAAVQHAVSIVQHFNKESAAKGGQVFDVKVAADRLAAVHTLGMQESAKVASAKDVEAAVEIRALEYLEAAGYPVTWPE